MCQLYFSFWGQTISATQVSWLYCGWTGELNLFTISQNCFSTVLVLILLVVVHGMKPKVCCLPVSSIPDPLIQTHTHTHSDTFLHTNTYTLLHTLTHSGTLRYTSTVTCIHTPTIRYTQNHTHSCTHAHACRCMNTQVCVWLWVCIWVCMSSCECVWSHCREEGLMAA